MGKGKERAQAAGVVRGRGNRKVLVKKWTGEGNRVTDERETGKGHGCMETGRVKD